MVGPQLLNADNSLQRSVGVFPTLATEFLSSVLVRLFRPFRSEANDIPAVPASSDAVAVEFIVGACMMVRRTALEAVGAFDEDYFFLYEEVDWCFRMRKDGWQVHHLPTARIVHLGGQSMKEINLRARVESWNSRYLYFRKSLELSGPAWYGLLTLGLLQNAYQFCIYSLLCGATFFLLRRLRRRWQLFGYLLLWHLRGRPVSMGIPRS